jgi:hypothetical protein
VFLKTARFAVEAKIDLPRFAIVTPFPNTGLYNRLAREGRILTRDWELYDGQHVVFQPKRMSVRELQDGTEAAWKHAYSLGSIARRLPHSPAPWGVRLATNLGYRFYAHRLSRFYNCDWIIGRAGRNASPTPQQQPAATTPRRQLRQRSRSPSPSAGREKLTIIHPCIGRRAGDTGTSGRGRWSRCRPPRWPGSRRPA